MDFMKFENAILTDLKNKNEACLTKIKNNKSLIEIYFKDGEKKDLEQVIEFVEKLNEIILNNSNNNLSLIEKVLHHNSFNLVLSQFRNSTILIKACEKKNIKVIKWLLTININPYVQDEQGRTALMLSAKDSDLFFVFKKLFNKNDKNLLLKEDNNGETVIFYSVYNLKALKEFVYTYDSNIDFKYNHKNHQGENVLIYCCKRDILKPIPILLDTNVKINIEDNDGNTAGMYLAKNYRHNELRYLDLHSMKCNYRNNRQETLFTSLIHSVYNSEKPLEKRKEIEQYYSTFKLLIEIGCNPNIPFDKDGNTPLMFYIMTHDIIAVQYILEHCSKIDYYLKNKNGQNAFTLALQLHNEYLIKYILRQNYFNTSIKEENLFKFEPIDQYNNNILMLYVLENNIKMVKYVVNKDNKLIYEVNNKKENALIIATKLGHKKLVNLLLKMNSPVNQQDILGNTALYYAVDINDSYIVNSLAFYQGDPNIKNRKGKSPLDFAIEIGDKNIIENLLHPTYPSPIKNKNNNKLNNKFNSISNQNDISIFTDGIDM
ncbi:ankyrin [Anaeromyces robustus]|uniref:Ankyrin n=1 Tax=Anaeromyces robustus TaxID=1754192 RepID=A0A1Y1XJ77_9FUNG|nr:ankyrin [Anaeromyces robustus]|eukprot:ORX85805.1 ankyrin [Anaeromyces robustus]